MPAARTPRNAFCAPDPDYVKPSKRQRKTQNEMRRSEEQIAARETLRHNPLDPAAMRIFQKQNIYHNKTSLVGAGAVAPGEARLPASVVDPLDSSGVRTPDVETEDFAMDMEDTSMEYPLPDGMELGDESDGFSAYNEMSIASSDDEPEPIQVNITDVTSAWSLASSQHSFIPDIVRAARPLSWWCKPRTYISCDFETSRNGKISQVGFASVYISQEILDRLHRGAFLPMETDYYHLMTRDQLFEKPAHWDKQWKYRNDRRNLFGNGTSKVIPDEELNEYMRQEICFWSLGRNQDDVCLVLHDARAEPLSCQKHNITALDDFCGFVDTARPGYGYFRTLDTQSIFAGHPCVCRRQPSLEFLVDTLLKVDPRHCHNALNDAAFTLWLLCLYIHEQFQQ
ncbi:hypothetical protein ONS96_000021 [Cadophora gregata f. sp. sojae]|nr:hypothetical protein ONS96_000021 [Cadophora gregata f. sp. sojae]